MILIYGRQRRKENEKGTKGKITDTLIITNTLARRKPWKLRTSDGKLFKI